MIDGGTFTSPASKVHFAGLRPPLILPSMADVTPQKPEEFVVAGCLQKP